MFDKNEEVFEGEEEFFETVAASEVIPHKAGGKADRMYRSEKARTKRKILHEKQGRIHAKGYKGS